MMGVSYQTFSPLPLYIITAVSESVGQRLALFFSLTAL